MHLIKLICSLLKVTIILVTLIPLSHANIQCAIISKFINDHQYRIRPIRCKPGWHVFPTAQLQKVQFIESNIVNTEVNVKIGSVVHFRYSQESQSKQVAVYNRKIRGIPLIPAWAAYFTFATMVTLIGIVIQESSGRFALPETHILVPDNYYDNTYNNIVNKHNTIYNENNTQVIIHYKPDPQHPIAVAPTKKTTPAKSGTTCSGVSKKSGPFVVSSTGSVDKTLSRGKGRGRGDQPPTKPPFNYKKVPDDKIAFDTDEEDDSDNDVTIIDNDVTILEDNEVEIISYNEFHLPASVGSVITVTQCQPSTSSQASASAASASAAPVSRASSVSSVLTIDSSSSEASANAPLTHLSISLPTVRANAGVAEPQIGSPVFAPIPAEFHWNGLIWGTTGSGITNTCNYDSFLSHLIYLGRRDPTYFARNLNLIDSIAEEAVRSVTNFYRSLHPNNLRYSYLSHMQWRNSLVNPLLDRPANFPADPVDNVINMASSPAITIHDHLSDSSRVWFLHSCACANDQTDLIDNDEYTTTDLQQLNNNQYVSSKKSNKKCKSCKKPFAPNPTPVISPATWFHAFRLLQGQNIHDLPQSLFFRDITTNEMVEFELGFISFTAYQTQAFGHQTSVHNIDGTLRYYNGMQNDGDLQNIPANIMTDKFEMDQVYYFRK